MNASRDLLKGLLEYIEEQAKEIDPKSYCIATAKGFVRRHLELVGLPGLDYDIRSEGDHVWLRLERLAAINPPVVPDMLRNLCVVSNDPFAPPPSLDESKLAEVIADAQSDAEQQLQAYAAQWMAWSASEQPRRTSINLYGELFALKYQLETEETAKPQELVWGVGMTLWKIPFEDQAITFEYPLLTQGVEISLDEKSMALEIRPRDTPPRLEMAAFVACAINGATTLEHDIKQQLADITVTPFDATSYADLLKLVASLLDSHGSYRELLAEGVAMPAASDELMVTDVWVLLSRPRATHYLLEDLRQLKENLDFGCAIPEGPLALVAPPSDQPIDFESIYYRGLSSRGSGHGVAEELYFPLPYNDEQVTIIQRLEKAAGVTVQGPPGTGKTHTIANVICHYLATGRRVLVTSRGESALEVLQSKIPEEIRPLTVALMSGDREGTRQFEAAISAIQHHVSQLNPALTSKVIDNLLHTIDKTHRELATIDKRLDEIALAHLSDVEIDGVPKRAQELATLVIAGKELYEWFDDVLTLAPEHAPPLSEEEAQKLREARRLVGQDLAYVQACFPSAESLPEPSAIGELHEVLTELQTIEAEIERGDLLALQYRKSDTFVALRELLDLVESTTTIVQTLESEESTWPFDLRTKCRLPSFESARCALEAMFKDMELLIKARATFLKRPVEFPDAGLSAPKTREAVARAAISGKPFGLLSTFGVAEAKQHLVAVKIAGLPPTTTGDWAHIERYMIVHEQVTSFVSRWNQVAAELSIPQLESGFAALRNIERVAMLTREAHRLATQIDTTLIEKAEAVFVTAPRYALLHGSSALNDVKTQILRHLSKEKLSASARQLTALEEQLAGKTGAISIQCREFITHQLGDVALSSGEIVTRYKALIAELRRLAALSLSFCIIYDLANRIKRACAPQLAERLCSQYVEQSGEDTVFPVTWREAWTWARIKSYLDSIDARAELVTLAAKRQQHEHELARFYKEMVAQSAWLATKNKATHKVLQALAGYATAIRRIGQGTGPNATRYRRDAQIAMRDAESAVPCWIMSHARISESMPPHLGSFDLVIVDEASQSDLWALPAILRGKKILVVGDDKQVSPDSGFKDSKHIQRLKDRFLADQPYGTEMTPEKSLYDLAARVFAADQVMLREHFRCVPPIIAYSNRTFYKESIQPLRIPTAWERIDPPLVDIYVPHGYRNNRKVNEAEAEAIASEIEAILEHKAFSGRTIGIVSLLGIEQAKYIDTLVRQRCSATELLRRKFACGDARIFQGSERDIMFLSMVVDRNSCKALSGNQYDQRFNVAASRARDRMYLVRSVTEHDLSDKDLRLTLLRHFDKPLAHDSAEVSKLIDKCESGFEKEVFLALTSRGYNVTPQVRSGAYRIDMVVEGVVEGANDHRLAIELDGDEFHGADRWQHDMSRQRILERTGWQFWRCFASTWLLQKDEVLSELLALLKTMGIEPLGAMQYTPRLIEKREWVTLPETVTHITQETQTS